MKRCSIVCVVFVFFIVLANPLVRASNGNGFTSASMVMGMMADKYTWLTEHSLRDSLFFEFASEDIQLLGFSSPDDVIGGSQKCFALVVKKDKGRHSLVDLTDSVDPRYTAFYAETIALPAKLGGAIWLQAEYFTHHVLPSAHVIDETGVILNVTGELIEVIDGDLAQVVVIGYSTVSDRDGSLPYGSGDKDFLPLDQSFGGMLDGFVSAPYERSVYVWNQIERVFVLTETTPVTPYAIAGLFLQHLQESEFEAAAGYLSDKYLECFALHSEDDIERYFRERFNTLLQSGCRFLMFDSMSTMRIQTASGELVQILFDRDLRDCYRTNRATFPDGIGSDPWVESPFINGIRYLQKITEDEAYQRLLDTWPMQRLLMDMQYPSDTPFIFGGDDDANEEYYEFSVYKDIGWRYEMRGAYRVSKYTGRVYAMDMYIGMGAEGAWVDVTKIDLFSPD